MFAVPYRRVDFKSRYSPMEFTRRLEKITSRRHRWFRQQLAGVEFIGVVCNSGFRLTPIVKGQNSYAPWILGNIRATEGGSRIDVRMTLHPIIVLALVSLTLAPQYDALSGNGRLNFWWIAVIGLLHVVLYYVGFVPEVRNVEARMRQIAG